MTRLIGLARPGLFHKTVYARRSLASSWTFETFRELLGNFLRTFSIRPIKSCIGDILPTLVNVPTQQGWQMTRHGGTHGMLKSSFANTTANKLHTLRFRASAVSRCYQIEKVALMQTALVLGNRPSLPFTLSVMISCLISSLRHLMRHASGDRLFAVSGGIPVTFGYYWEL